MGAALTMAGFLSLEFSAAVEGPYGQETVRVWLGNGRGVSLTHDPERDAAGRVELMVIREVIDGHGGTDSVHDYSTPVTNDTVPSQSLDDVRAALTVLRDMPASDRYDLRASLPGGGE